MRPPKNQERLAEAAAADHDGDYDRATKIYRTLAEEGDAGGQFCLGNRLREEENFGEAFAWTRRSAEQGLGPAQHNLAMMYMAGMGVPQDLAAARQWLAAASAQEVTGSRDLLAQLDLTEPLLPLLDRVDMEYIVALEGGWNAHPRRPPAEIIAFQGSAPHKAFTAMAGIGWMEQAEHETLPVPTARLFRITEAGVLAIPNAMSIFRAWPDRTYPLRREGWLHHRDFAAAKSKAGEFSLALDTWRNLASEGDELAQFHIGWMISRGEGAAVDDVEALSWFRQSAEDGAGLSCEYVAHYYQEGRGVRQDFEVADFWYRKAIEHDGPTAERDRAILAASPPMLPLLNALTVGDHSVLGLLAQRPADTSVKPGSPKHSLYLEMKRLGWLQQVPPPADWPSPDLPVFQSTPLGCKAIPQLIAIHAGWPWSTPPQPGGDVDLVRPLPPPPPMPPDPFWTNMERPQPSSPSGWVSWVMRIWRVIERGRDDDVSSLRRIATPVLLFAVLLFVALGILRLVGLVHDFLS